MRAAYEAMVSSRSGGFAFVRGAHGTGRTTLLAQFAYEALASAAAPIVVGGGFDGSSDGLRAWHLPRGIELLRSLPSAVTGLGSVAATAAAAAAVAEPTGIGRLAVSLTALAGQATQTAGLMEPRHVDDAGVGLSPSRAYQAISALLSHGRPTVVLIDDFDHGRPALEWCAVFLERWAVAAARRHPLLVVLSSGPPQPRFAASTDNWVDAALARIARSDLGVIEIALNLLTQADLHSWLAPVDDSLIDALHECAGGDPGWTVELLSEWKRRGVVAKTRTGSLAFSGDRRAARDETALAYVDTALWRMFAPDVANYDRARIILRAGSLEGAVFTVQVVANALGEDADSLMTWIEDNLVRGEDPSAPLVRGASFVTDRGGRQSRLSSYRFVGSIAQSAFRHEVAHDTEAGENSLAARYAVALAATYGAAAPLALMAGLYRLAQQIPAAEQCERQLMSEATLSTFAEALAHELSLIHEAPPSTDWSVGELLTSATRLIFSLHALREHMDDREVVSNALIADTLLERVSGFAPPVDIEALRSHLLQLIAFASFALQWHADAIEFAHASAAACMSCDEPARAAAAHAVAIGSYGRLLQMLRNGVPGAFDGCVKRHIKRMVQADLLPPDLRSQHEGTAATQLIAGARRAEAAAALALAAAAHVGSHLEGELALARSEVRIGLDDHDGASESLVCAAQLFAHCEHGTLCPRRGEALSRLVAQRFQARNLPGAELAAQHAMYVLMTHNNFWRASQVQQTLAVAYWAASNRRAAYMAVAVSIELTRRAGRQHFEGQLWGLLAEILADDHLAAPEQRKCLAMAVIHSDALRDHFRERLEGACAASSTVDMLELAVHEWKGDRGAALLRRVTGVTAEEVARLLAETAREPPEGTL